MKIFGENGRMEKIEFMISQLFWKKPKQAGRTTGFGNETREMAADCIGASEAEPPKQINNFMSFL